MKNRLKSIFLSLLSFSTVACSSQNIVFEEPPLLDKIYHESAFWVDSVMNTLTDDEKISQLFWLSMEYPPATSAFAKGKLLVEKYQPGGILIMRMKSLEAYDLIQDLQSISKLPLLVSMDAEYGLAMRMLDLTKYPMAMTLGAINDNNLIYELGHQIAEDFKVLGVHVNMAPVADVNSNPKNPVIGMRSFGENPINVAEKSVAYMLGMQNNGVMGVGKHFPGHGNTESDSHFTLPLVNSSKNELDSIDLLPFRALIDDGIWGVMSAHLQVPALNPNEEIPTSFSKVVLDSLLKEQMGFKGLVISDAINMKGAKFMGEPGKIDALALMAGTDIVEFTENLPLAIESVKNAINDSLISWKFIDDKCRKSLAFKYWLIENNNNSKVEKDSLFRLLSSEKSMVLRQKLYDSSLTALKVLPSFYHTEKHISDSTLFINVGNNKQLFVDEKVEVNLLSQSFLFNEFSSKVKDKSQIVLFVEDGKWIRNAVNQSLVKELYSKTNNEIYIVFMDNPYFLSQWKNFITDKGLLLTYEFNRFTIKSVLKFISGEISVSGRVPVSISGVCNEGDGAVVK